MFTSTGVDALVQWSYVRCSAVEYAVITGADSIQCVPCPLGADCSPQAALAQDLTSAPSGDFDSVVQLSDVVARPGYWAAPTSDGLTYYPCPIDGACVLGGNGSRARCAEGYAGIACRYNASRDRTSGTP